MLDANGIALFAVSYDALDVLRAFAEAHGIAFPLLSDQGSHVMRRLGLVNERVMEDHAVYGIAANPRHAGVPYPGVFVLGEAGIVTQKRFHESYRERDTGAGLIADTLGLIEPPAADAATSLAGAVRVRAWLGSPTYSFFQRIPLNVEVAVAPGWHVYGAPTPDGLVPLSVAVASVDGVQSGAATWPAPHRLDIGGLDAALWGHDGVVRGSLPLTFSAPPGGGDHLLRVTVTYQACDGSTCLPPVSARFDLPVTEVGLVGRALPARPRPA